LEEIGTHPLWGDVFIDRSLHQAQEHGFRELISQDKQRKILSNPERGIALVFYKDDTEKFYKLHASKVVEYIRKDVYCESRVYNAALFYALDQQQRAQEAIIGFIKLSITHLTKRCQPYSCLRLPSTSAERSCYLWSMSSLSYRQATAFKGFSQVFR